MSNLPPLVPLECDLQDFRFMPLDVARLRDSDLAADETPEACWAALLLWAASWHQIPAASIPDNDQWQAKQAGYVSRGRIDPAWAKVRTGALRGFVMCEDGRLYHPVVAEKAREAWKSKLDKRWATERARVKKHNDRHGTSIPMPTFDEWMSLGCPQGQRLDVPRDIPPRPPFVPRERGSKGQGEGQGEGQGQGQPNNPSGEGGVPPPPPPAPPAPPKAKAKSAAEEEKSRLWADLKTAMVADGKCADFKAAGALLTASAKKYGEEVFVAAARETVAEPRAETHSYFIGACERAAGKRAPVNRQEAIEQRNRAVAEAWVPPAMRQAQGAA